MAEHTSPRREYERVLPAPSRGARGESDAEAAYYERLMQVTVRDTYYPWPHHCPDFAAAPSAATAQLMVDLGLLFRPEANGFSILYDRSRAANLLSYLSEQRKGDESWTRLSIELSLRNVYFGNFTHVPVDLDPTTRNFYFTNRRAHVRGGSVVLNQHRYVTGRELLPVVPVQFPVYVGPQVREVRLIDVSGAQVLCVPRCIPEKLGPDAKCGDVRQFFEARGGQERCTPVKWVCRNTLYLDLSLLSEDRYTIQEIGRRGGVLREKEVLFTGRQKYCFLDLFFAQPRPSSPPSAGVYPVQGLGSSDPSIVPVHYELAFKRRSTYWRYYVVLPGGRREESLSITTEPPGAVTFSGPCPVVIGNATAASMFVSTAPVPLKAPAPARFILNSIDGPLMVSMPVASVKQILPESDSAFSGGSRLQPRFREYSDIYVYV
jgi:hypothetical protein